MSDSPIPVEFRGINSPVANSVGGLIEILQKLPSELPLHCLDDNGRDCEFVRLYVAEWPGQKFVCQFDGSDGVPDWRAEMIGASELYRALSKKHEDVHIEWVSPEPAADGWMLWDIVSGYSAIGESGGTLLENLRVREGELQSKAADGGWVGVES